MFLFHCHSNPLADTCIYPTAAAAAAKSLQSCPTLCDLMDGSPLGSCVHRILQARILQWIAFSFSNIKYYLQLKTKEDVGMGKPVAGG